MDESNPLVDLLENHVVRDPLVLKLSRASPSEGRAVMEQLIALLVDQFTPEMMEKRRVAQRDQTMPEDVGDHCFKDPALTSDIVVAFVKVAQAGPGAQAVLMQQQHQFEASLIDVVLRNTYLRQHAQARNKRFWAALLIGAAMTFVPALLHTIKQMRRK